MYKATFTFLISLLLSCSASTEDNLSNNESATNNNDSIITSHLPEIIDSVTKISTYKGSWFEIDYPSHFKSSPNQPMDSMENYVFIKTNEAYFLSEDKQVEFFVYSPQWGGNPLNYLNVLTDEAIESEKTAIDEINPETVINWVTIKGRNYSRSYYSKRTSSTHLVFGIKYSNQENYSKYKADYKAFKKSLIQYAD